MSDPTIYTVGWICAILPELVAAKAFLDEEHPPPDEVPVNDNNTYVLGRIGKHNVVIASLPDGRYGLTSAADVAGNLVRTFPNLRIGLMVGVAGGAPTAENDIRLGDVVVSSPGGRHAGVLQYDFGKTIQDRAFALIGHLRPPPDCLLTALIVLRAKYVSDDHGLQPSIDSALGKMKRKSRKEYSRPAATTDVLYRSSYTHVGTDDTGCGGSCNAEETVCRDERDEEDILEVHFGLIASANNLMKNAVVRDQLAADEKVLCFEMEAAGLMNRFPCLIIRGICDYSDTHKNWLWQPYAAMTAAAFAKDLLNTVQPNKVEGEARLSDVLGSVNEKLDSLGDEINTIRSTMTKIHSSAKFNELLHWLVPGDLPNVSIKLEQLLAARQPGTGQRLIKSGAYCKWKSQPRSFLWLKGITGSGKTFLTSTIIEDLGKGLTCSSHLLYYFFDFTKPPTQIFDNMVRSLASQLYLQSTETRATLDALLASCGGSQRQPGATALQEAFVKMTEVAGEVRIILDALDECKRDDGKLMQWVRDIRKLQSDNRLNVHLLMASRPEPDISEKLKELCCSDEIMTVKGDVIEQDISDFVKSQVREGEGLRRWRNRPDTQAKIENTLIGKADGMFRWAACQVEILKKCLDARTLNKALHQLPKTLNETYAQVLRDIPPEYKKQAIRLLQLLLYSRRPLRLDEMVDALAVNMEEDAVNTCRFDKEHRIPIPAEITLYCPGLVVYTQEPTTPYWGRYGNAGVIKLAHLSVKEYLTTACDDNDFSELMGEAVANIAIAEVCLTYLLEIPAALFKNASPLQIELHIELDYPLMCYSARQWATSARTIQSPTSQLFALTEKLFSNPEHMLFCVGLDEVRVFDPEQPLHLYYASLLGIGWFAKALLEQGAKTHDKGGYYGNALQAAAVIGSMEIAEVLIDRGADVNARGGQYGNALQAATAYDCKEIIELLVAQGADVNAQGGRYDTALRAALVCSSKETVELLIDRGANINAQGVDGNALQAAVVVFPRSTEIIELLLARGANVNAQGGYYGNALQAAACHGYKECVELLLARGANVNAQGGYYGNALQAAARHGYKECVELLLARGANVNAQGGIFDNALYAAVDGESTEIVELLVARGADTNTLSGDFGNVLQAAAANGHLDMLQILLEKGADVNASMCNEDGVRRTVLDSACAYVDDQVAEVLLRDGPDGDLPLTSGSTNRAVLIIQMLLRAGAKSAASLKEEEERGSEAYRFTSHSEN